MWTPIISPFFGFLPDRGYALAKIFGLLLLNLIPWLLNFVFPSFEFFSGHLLSFFLSLNLFFLFWQLGKKKYPKISLRRILYSEALFSFFFFFCLLSFGFHSEFYGGEKPMDINLLSYALRFKGGVFEDPWFAGEQLHYYYWGYLLFSTVAKVAGVSGNLVYPLALSTSMGWFASILFSLFCFTTRRIKQSFLLSFTLLLAVNLKGIILFFQKFFSFSFDDFWSVSRVFEGQEFAEFPLWSYLFADLHPHVMSYPIAASVLLLTLYGLRIYFTKSSQFTLKQTITYGLICSLFFGSLLGMNTWDFLFFSLFNSGLFISYNINSREDLKERFRYAPNFFLVHLCGLLLFSPILFELSSHVKTTLSFYKGEGSGALPLIWLFGQWGIIFLLGRGYKKREPLSWLILCGFLLLLFENIVFMDRVNTLFKGLTALWWILGFAALSTLVNTRRWVRYACCGILILPTLSLMIAISSYRPFGRLQYSLHGDRYLKKADLVMYEVIQWVNKNVEGTPRLAERYGRSFDYPSNILSSHTGMPSYLGWDHHVSLRGKKWAAVFQRKQILDRIYRGRDPLKSYELLREQGIDYIMVGKNERKYYTASELDKFKEYRDLFIAVAGEGDTILYRIKK